MMERWLCLSIPLVTLTGCGSFSSFGLARTLNKGAVQGWVAPSGGGAVSINSKTRGAVGYPLLEGGVRYGVTERVELGGKLGFNGITADGKFGLIRSPAMDSGFNLSVDPAVGFIGYGAGGSTSSGDAGGFIGVLTLSLPVLIGFD